ncbi:MAG TPA: isocitrate lyase/PEP mutase family protein [Kofleriaceae bacterium]|jgi:2-methylisocitrate lyase-like PEP mutase family enzyme|nr:isocitrate lyase/PEP mutase family protein [Kofleriaceae bacterium]
MTISSPARAFRALLSGSELIVAPGAYDALTARLVEQAGFPIVYMTGAGTAAARGFPDYGLVTLSEMADTAGVIARSVAVPVLADADTGYGNELNVTRTVREFEARGVAGIHLEDQVAPKRCGHLDGKAVIDRDEFVSKIRAAVAARRDPDFVVIARTDAVAVHGLDDAIERANAALAAGADLAFVEAPPSVDDVAAIPRRVHGPCLLNLVPGGKTPITDLAQVATMGYRLVILPGLLIGAAVLACDAVLSGVARSRAVPGSSASTAVRELFRRLGSEEWDAIARRFAGG